jgi:hypothetical protein
MREKREPIPPTPDEGKKDFFAELNQALDAAGDTNCPECGGSGSCHSCQRGEAKMNEALLKKRQN